MIISVLVDDKRNKPIKELKKFHKKDPLFCFQRLLTDLYDFLCVYRLWWLYFVYLSFVLEFQCSGWMVNYIPWLNAWSLQSQRRLHSAVDKNKRDTWPFILNLWMKIEWLAAIYQAFIFQAWFEGDNFVSYGFIIKSHDFPEYMEINHIKSFYWIWFSVFMLKGDLLDLLWLFYSWMIKLCHGKIFFRNSLWWFVESSSASFDEFSLIWEISFL